jgi:protein disulfide-isomerase A6
MMWNSHTLAASTVAILLSAQVDAGSLYTKTSPVLQVTAKTYDKLITKSNHTSVS